jgi:hypothetical protein
MRVLFVTVLSLAHEVFGGEEEGGLWGDGAEK